MFDDNEQGPDLDTLIGKIKEEAKRRRAQLSGPYAPEDLFSKDPESKPGDMGMRETTAYRLLKKIQNALRTYPFYRIFYPIAYKLKKIVPKYRDGVSVKDLIKYNDREFVDNAYRVLLGRAPDPQGADRYLSSLRDGQKNKIEILGNIRYSHEGVRRNVDISGLFFMFNLERATRLPIVGYLLSAIVSLATLPRIMKKTQEREAASNARFTDIAATLQSIEKQQQDVVGVREQVRAQEQNLLIEIRKLMAMIESAAKQSTGGIDRTFGKGMGTEEDHLLDAMYVAFEERFRGAREDIKGRMKIYLPYITRVATVTGNAPILDAGCGRGEWLELMKEHGFAAKGVESNRVMTQRCKTLGLDVVDADIIEYLREVPPDSLSAITGFHVIEHLPFKSLIALIDESLRALKPGGMVLFETPNPENLLVSAYTFHLDPTHRAPLVPDSIQFILEQRGFIKVEVVRSHKYSDLHVVPEMQQTDFSAKWFYSETDFAVIGHKP